jgi:hypothetical protein
MTLSVFPDKQDVPFKLSLKSGSLFELIEDKPLEEKINFEATQIWDTLF